MKTSTLYVLGLLCLFISCSNEEEIEEQVPTPEPQVLSLEEVTTPELVASVGAVLEEIVVRVTDQDQVGVEDQTIEVSVVSGQGSLDQESYLTDANGEVSIIWTLGEEPGNQEIAVSLADSEQSLQYAGEAKNHILTLVNEEDMDISGKDTEEVYSITYQLLDFQGNPVENFPVDFEYDSQYIQTTAEDYVSDAQGSVNLEFQVLELGWEQEQLEILASIAFGEQVSQNLNVLSNPFYVDENGVTIKAYDWAEVGAQGEINGKVYTLVDNTALDIRIQNGEDITNIVTTRVTDMAYLFYEMEEFNEDISYWDTSNVGNMNSMFFKARRFNQDISYWDVSQVGSMEEMFLLAEDFNQNINNWNVENVIIMRNMFRLAKSFNQPLNNWNTASLEHCYQMFQEAESFNQDLDNWNMSKVNEITAMFAQAKNFNGKLNGWDVSNITHASNLFFLAENFNQDLDQWDTSSLRQANSMFYGAYAFNSDITTWNTSALEGMRGMFKYAESFNRDISNWDVSNVEVMIETFYAAVSFNQNISGWDVSNVWNMTGMFYAAWAFYQDLSGWDVSNVIQYSNFGSDYSEDADWPTSMWPNF